MTMTPTEIKEARNRLGLTVAEFARVLETDELSVRRMELKETASTFRRPAPRMERLIHLYERLKEHAPELLPADFPKDKANAQN